MQYKYCAIGRDYKEKKKYWIPKLAGMCVRQTTISGTSEDKRKWL